MPSDSAARRRKAKEESGATESKTDEEILAERAALEKIDTADTVLGSLGFVLWALCAAWLNYTDNKQEIPSLHHGCADALLILFVAGGFCRSMSKSSPRSWSTWRHVFQLSWAAVFGVIAFFSVINAFKPSTSGVTAPSSAFWGMAALCGAAAAGVVLTLPGASPKQGKSTEHALGRTVAFADGCFVIGLAATIFLRTPWSQPLGPMATAITAGPLCAWGFAMCMSATNDELIVSIPWAMFFYVYASARSYYYSSAIVAAPTIGAVVVHLALYSPKVLGDEDMNPYYMSVKRSIKSFQKLLSSDVTEGMMDDND